MQHLIVQLEPSLLIAAPFCAAVGRNQRVESELLALLIHPNYPPIPPPQPCLHDEQSIYVHLRGVSSR